MKLTKPAEAFPLFLSSISPPWPSRHQSLSAKPLRQKLWPFCFCMIHGGTHRIKNIKCADTFSIAGCAVFMMQFHSFCCSSCSSCTWRPVSSAQYCRSACHALTWKSISFKSNAICHLAIKYAACLKQSCGWSWRRGVKNKRAAAACRAWHTNGSVSLHISPFHSISPWCSLSFFFNSIAQCHAK